MVNEYSLIFILIGLGAGLILWLPLGIFIGKAIKSRKTVTTEGAFSKHQIRSRELEDERQEHTKRWQILSSLISSLGNIRQLDKMLEVVAHLAKHNMKVEYAAVFMKEKEAFVPQATEGLSADTVNLLGLSGKNSLVQYLEHTKNPVHLSKRRQDAQLQLFSKYKESINEVILFPLQTTGKMFGILWVANRIDSVGFDRADIHLISYLGLIFSLFIHNMILYSDLEKAYLSTTFAIANALDAKDKSTRFHSKNVTEYSVKFARAIHLKAEEIESIRVAALLHDIGKIGVPDSVLNKPGKLTPEEFEIVKAHPLVGAEILRPLSFLEKEIPGILYHHEKYDGTGYPKRLARNEIPLMAVIICLADVYDALTTDKPYRKAFSPEEALVEMKGMVEKNFEPRFFNAFSAIIEREYIRAHKS